MAFAGHCCPAQNFLSAASTSRLRFCRGRNSPSYMAKAQLCRYTMHTFTLGLNRKFYQSSASQKWTGTSTVCVALRLPNRPFSCAQSTASRPSGFLLFAKSRAYLFDDCPSCIAKGIQSTTFSNVHIIPRFCIFFNKISAESIIWQSFCRSEQKLPSGIPLDFVTQEPIFRFPGSPFLGCSDPGFLPCFAERADRAICTKASAQSALSGSVKANTMVMFLSASTSTRRTSCCS